jgi:hypothetical protein
MANTANPTRMVGRSALLLLFVLCFVPYGEADADFGGGVLGFLRRLEETAAKKTLWFYRFFGANLHPSKLNIAKDCDYDDPNKIQFCPPALNPMAHSSTGSRNALAENSLPSKCLEDPDDAECRKLRELFVIVGLPGMDNNDGPPEDDDAPPVPAPHSYVTDFPIGSISTQAPTKDNCYGNMAKNPKFCNSEMPSVSLEPSEQPTAFPEGGETGDEVDFPTADPSADTFNFPSETSDIPSDPLVPLQVPVQANPH